MDKFATWLNKQSPESIEEIRNSRVGFYFIKSTTQVVIQDIFTLIDSPAFLLNLSSIRHTLKIKKIPFTSYYNLVIRAGVNRTPPYTRNMTSKEFAQTLTIPYYWHKILSLWHPLKSVFIKKLELESLELLMSLNKPPYLVEAVMQAILFNQVGWGNSIHKYTNTDNYSPLPEAMSANTFTINPRTTYEEVKQAMKTIGEGYFRHNKYKELPKYMPHFMDYHFWYWSRMEGQSYTQIANTWTDDPNHKAIDENDVSRAVNKYAKLLNF